MFEKLNQTDKVVAAVLGLTFLIFLINAKLALTALVYLNALCGLSLFLYSIWRFDSGKILRRNLIIGAVASGTYLVIDRLFSSSAVGSIKLITYLGSDSRFFSRFIDVAPPSIVLNWVCLITIALYFYQRLRSFFSRAYIPILLTVISVFLGSVLLSELGNSARLWNWNEGVVNSLPFIFSTPLSYR